MIGRLTFSLFLYQETIGAWTCNIYTTVQNTRRAIEKKLHYILQNPMSETSPETATSPGNKPIDKVYLLSNKSRASPLLFLPPPTGNFWCDQKQLFWMVRSVSNTHWQTTQPFFCIRSPPWKPDSLSVTSGHAGEVIRVDLPSLDRQEKSYSILYVWLFTEAKLKKSTTVQSV